jgi:hypothetical protein
MHNDTRSEDRHETEPQRELLLLDALWFFVRRHGRTLVTGLAVALGVFGVLACGLYCLLPVHTDAWTELRFVFNGVDQDQYPNGLPFAAEELLAVPVLDEVYRRNGLAAYLKFDQFAKALSISQANRQLDALERRYQGLLADKKLTAAERSRIEDDWYKQSQQLRSAQYTLHYSTVSRRLLPEAVVRKVLADIPMAWADFAIRQKGVLTYGLACVSPLEEKALAAKFPLYALQEVYTTAGALQSEIDDLRQLPGAGLLRPPTVPATAEDLRIGVNALMRFSLPTIYRDVLLDSLRRDPESTRRQLDSITSSLTIKSNTATRMAANYLTAYQQYMQKGVPGGNPAEAVVPPGGSSGGAGGGMGFVAQIDSGFLDRISGMATQSLDVAYRQKLIDDYTLALNTAEKVKEDLAFIQSNVTWAMEQKPAAVAAAALGGDVQIFAAVVKPLNVLVEQTDAFVRQLSRHNLENGTRLYQTVKPFQMQRCGVLSWRWWFAALVAWNGGICLLLAAVLGWRDRSASGPASRCAGA